MQKHLKYKTACCEKTFILMKGKEERALAARTADAKGLWLNIYHQAYM